MKYTADFFCFWPSRSCTATTTVVYSEYYNEKGRETFQEKEITGNRRLMSYIQYMQSIPIRLRQ
jgi:hypothetical protein